MKHIGRQSVSSAKWSVATTIGRFLLQLVAQVVLARVLGPDTYGLFGMGLVVFNLSNFLATFGFGWSLAQLKSHDSEDIEFAFTWQMIVGFTAAALLFAGSSAIADYFQDPRLDSVVQWMALACVINAAGSVSGNLMRRDMKFRASGSIQMASYAAGYLLTGLPLALLGAGVNALIAAWLVQSIVVTAAGYWITRHPLRPRLRCAQSRRIVKIGATVFFTNLGNWLINSLDRLLIGRILNAHALGIYTAAYNLANMPNSLLVGAIQPVFLTAGAHVQDNQHKLKQAYLQVLATIWVLMLPAFVFLASIAAPLVLLLYGPAWQDTAAVLAVFFLAMPFLVTWGLSAPILWNNDKAHLEILIQLPLLPVGALAYYFFTSRGVLAASLVSAGVMVLRGIVMACTASRLLQVGRAAWRDFLLRGLLLSAGVAAIAALVSLGLPAVPHPLLDILLRSAITAGAAIALVCWRPSVLGTDAAAMLIRFVPRLANLLQPQQRTA